MELEHRIREAETNLVRLETKVMGLNKELTSVRKSVDRLFWIVTMVALELGITGAGVFGL